MKKILVGLLIIIVLVISVGLLYYKNSLKAVSNTSKEIEFKVEKGSTFSSLSSSLKSSKLIKNELTYKIYIKLNKPTSLQAGTYLLNQNMNVKEIIETLKGGSSYNPDAIKITFKEGLTVPQFVRVLKENTNNKEDEIYKVLKDEVYLKKLINKYYFLTDDILNKKIYYPLEGYLYPNTYEFMNKDVKVETVIETMLDTLESKLSSVKEKLDSSKYSYHQIFTLASMIQSEGNNIDDFKNMASVFITRLDKKMKLQSCASAYYGAKKEMGKDEFGNAYTLKNNYNTYETSALPVGPISNPGMDAILATLSPSNNGYLYFASDKNMKVYFSKTYEEHTKTVNQLKASGNWYGS